MGILEKQVITKILQVIYVFVFIFSISLITTMHIIPSPALAVFRIPQNLREIGPSLGLVWPTSLHVYHIFLFLFFTVVFLNGLGLRNLRIAKWRSILRISSFFGLLMMWSVSLFFMLPLILNNNFDPINLKTSFIYSLFSFAFFIVNLLTFTVVQKEGKQAARI